MPVLGRKGDLRFGRAVFWRRQHRIETSRLRSEKIAVSLLAASDDIVEIPPAMKIETAAVIFGSVEIPRDPFAALLDQADRMPLVSIGHCQKRARRKTSVAWPDQVILCIQTACLSRKMDDHIVTQIRAVHGNDLQSAFTNLIPNRRQRVAIAEGIGTVPGMKQSEISRNRATLPPRETPSVDTVKPGTDELRVNGMGKFKMVSDDNQNGDIFDAETARKLVRAAP